MKNSRVNITNEEHIFQFAGYLITCAEMALSPRGSPRYSALRFIEVYRRLTDLHKSVDCIAEDKFLINIKERIDQLNRDPNQMEDFRSQLHEILLEFADEATQRLKK